MSNDRAIKTVKILVIVMSALIMVGLSLMAYSLLIRGDTSVSSQTSVSLVEKDRVVPDTNLVPFGIVALAQPPGTQIAAMAVADQRLFLWLKNGAQQEERIILVDFATGRTLGTITVGSTPIGSTP